jgi:hypothetical protein
MEDMDDGKGFKVKAKDIPGFADMSYRVFELANEYMRDRDTLPPGEFVKKYLGTPWECTVSTSSYHCDDCSCLHLSQDGWLFDCRLFKRSLTYYDGPLRLKQCIEEFGVNDEN